jgi:hypothetical protein
MFDSRMMLRIPVIDYTNARDHFFRLYDRRVQSLLARVVVVVSDEEYSQGDRSILDALATMPEAELVARRRVLQSLAPALQWGLGPRTPEVRATNAFAHALGSALSILEARCESRTVPRVDCSL